jgi:glycosyltransferase involved in cell wall biosynthesis
VLAMDAQSVSVAMCTFNGSRFLPEQLASIAAQSKTPYELVVCDDGSRDVTLEILRKFASSVKFPVRIVDNAGGQLGCTKNFERAIRLCEGTFISLADQDDIWLPQKLEVLSTTLSNNPAAGYCFSDADLIDENSRLLGKRMWATVGFSRGKLADFRGTAQVSTLLRRATVTGATMIFRAQLRGLFLPLSAYLVHDYWISTLSSGLGFPGVPVAQPLVQYRRHSGQQIGPPDGSLLRKLRRAWNRNLDAYRNPMLGLEELSARLHTARSMGFDFPEVHVQLVADSLAHATTRAQAHAERGTRRFIKVLPEVATGRYARYSNSWASVVEDLCF